MEMQEHRPDEGASRELKPVGRREAAERDSRANERHPEVKIGCGPFRCGEGRGRHAGIFGSDVQARPLAVKTCQQKGGAASWPDRIRLRERTVQGSEPQRIAVTAGLPNGPTFCATLAFERWVERV